MEHQESQIPDHKSQISNPPPSQGRDVVLAKFIRICSAVLSSPLPHEAAATAVNRISEIVRVDRAVLVHLRGKHAIAAVTGGGAAAQDSSFADAVEAVRREYRDQQMPVLIPPKVREEEKGGNRISDSVPLRKVREAMGGTGILWMPLWLDRDAKIPPAHALWLERWNSHPWEKGDVELLRHAALFIGHGLCRQRKMTRSKRRFFQIALVLLLAVFLALPITSGVSAPARVLPDHPHHIFAPMDGILKELLVQPGQEVRENTLLFRYDARVLDKRLEEAYRSVAVAKAKLVRLQGKAHRDPEARAELPVQQLEVERAEADVEFYTKQRDRAELRTAKSGVIVLEDPDALVGATLRTGQAVLSVADPSQTKVRIMVPAGDAGFLREGATVSVRMDSNPLLGIPAVIKKIGFDITLSEEGVPSVLAEAVWDGDVSDIRPGQKGTARIFGETTRLGMQILRKPLIKLRSLAGF